MDVNRSIGWWNFFATLKHTFFNKKVSLSVSPNNSNVIRCVLELNFATIGRTSIELKLTKVNNPWNSIVEMFVIPLYEFYHVRTEAETTEKLEQLDKQIKLYQDKLTHSEQMAVKKIPSQQVEVKPQPIPVTIPAVSPTKNSSDKTGSELVTMTPQGSELVVPSSKILAMHKTIKNKLVENKSIVFS